MTALIQIAKRNFFACLSIASFVLMASNTSIAVAQQIQVSTPFQTASDSYFERFGVGFGASIPGNSRIMGLTPGGMLTPNINVSQGSAGGTIPGLGGFDPNSQLSTGAAYLGNGGGISLNFFAGKGSTRSISSTTPSVVVQNGQFGSIFSGSNRPFVTSIDPVIGGGGFGGGLGGFGGMGGGVVAQRLTITKPLHITADPHAGNEPIPLVDSGNYSDRNSTATRAALSIEEIKRQKEMDGLLANQKLKVELTQMIEAAGILVADEKYGAARMKYQRALRKIGDNTRFSELRESVSARYNEIKDKR